MITSPLFEAYLSCRMKCFLLSVGTEENENPIATWFENRNSAHRSKSIRSVEHVDADRIVVAGDLQANLHGLQRIRRARGDLLVPLRFVANEKPSRIDRLMIGFDAHVLSQTLGIGVATGRLICGKSASKITVNVDAVRKEVGRIAGKISELLLDSSPPDLILNRHCPYCEFRNRCAKKALEKNDLSLLAGMTEQERARWNRRGIFTVHQLSHTFRPRRRFKRLAGKPEKYHHSVKALAIREQKIHIVGDPRVLQVPLDGTPIFFDVEAMPDQDFFYLIGIRWDEAGKVVRHSLWADDQRDERRIWCSFLEIVSSIEKPILLHYGSFETTFLRKMFSRYGLPPTNSPVDRATTSAVNVLGLIFATVYFPTYSNGLKDVAGFLGFTWSDPESSGLQSIVWRQQWEESRDPSIAEKLVTYNQEDCEALRLVVSALVTIASRSSPTGQSIGESEIVHVDSLKKSLPSKWRTFESPLPGFVQINSMAHWNYQRDRVFVRTKPLRKKSPRTVRRKPKRTPALSLSLPTPSSCPTCAGKLKFSRLKSRVVKDLLFGRNSLKCRVVEYKFRTCRCRNCGYVDPLHDWYERGHARRWGWNILSYFVYNTVALRIPQRTVQRGLARLFAFDAPRSTLGHLKFEAAAYYDVTRTRILERIIQGSLIHADETPANIKGQPAYVWVLTNMEDVVYLLADSREGRVIQELLKDFKGVLVSDFYSVYDSLECRQQKCLIHLMRDLNDEVLNRPFDEELKSIVVGFGSLLKPIVDTIDRRGLRRLFLRKYIRDTERFYRSIEKVELRSGSALKCRERLFKNRHKLFTFLECDGIPWNNNNAEHAIKAFARLRNVISGTSTRKGIEEYLTLLSVAETCEYRRIDFLDFLRSGSKDVYEFVNG